jgi:hypothetical protein
VVTPKARHERHSRSDACVVIQKLAETVVFAASGSLVGKLVDVDLRAVVSIEAVDDILHTHVP